MAGSLFTALEHQFPLLFFADFTKLTPGAVSLAQLGLSFARASSATVQDSANTVITAGIGNDVPRAGNDGTHSGLVIEETRTNWLANSVPDAVNWTLGVGAIQTLGQVDPAGGTAGARIQSTSGNLGMYNGNAALALNVLRAFSGWTRVTSVPAQSQILGGFLTVNADAVALTTAFVRRTVFHSEASATERLYFGDGRDWIASGGIAAGARDEIDTFAQIEDGAFPTEYIPTSGATAARAGEHLFCAGPQLVSRGRVSMYTKLQPKGGSLSYGAHPRLWTLDANNYCEIDNATAKVLISDGGVVYPTPGSLGFNAGDTVEIWTAAGGGLATRVSYRVNGGAVTVLSTGAPPTQANFAQTTTLDWLCNGTTQQFTSWVQQVGFYSNGLGPAGF